MDSVLCNFVARFVPFLKDSHLDDTALLRSLALPLSRSLALPLSRALALSLSRSFALSLSRSPALSLSHSIALSLSLASIGCVFPDLCRVAARLSRSLELSLSRQKRSEESKRRGRSARRGSPRTVRRTPAGLPPPPRRQRRTTRKPARPTQWQPCSHGVPSEHDDWLRVRASRPSVFRAQSGRAGRSCAE